MIILLFASFVITNFPGSAQVVVRSLWDDRGRYQLAGVLREGCYRIDDVRKRTGIRSAVFAKILTILQKNNILLAVPGVRVETPMGMVASTYVE